MKERNFVSFTHMFLKNAVFCVLLMWREQCVNSDTLREIDWWVFYEPSISFTLSSRQRRSSSWQSSHISVTRTLRVKDAHRRDSRHISVQTWAFFCASTRMLMFAQMRVSLFARTKPHPYNHFWYIGTGLKISYYSRGSTLVGIFSVFHWNNSILNSRYPASFWR